MSTRVGGGPPPALTTVVMAAYETHATVRESVESVLAQTEPAVEVVVVDDGSRVPIATALREVRDPRLRLIRHERNRGIGSARNTGLRAARSPLVSQLDSDDVWKPDYLEHILPRFDDPAVGLAYANVDIRRHPEGRTIAIYDTTGHPIDSFPRICDSCPIPSATPTMRTDAVRRVGGWAEWLWATDDYHLYLKLAIAGWRFAYVDRVLATYTWPTEASGTTFHGRRMARDELRMWIRFMLRHPLTPGPRRQVRWKAAREARRLLRR